MKLILSRLYRSYLCFFRDQHVYRWFPAEGFHCIHCLRRAPEWL